MSKEPLFVLRLEVQRKSDPISGRLSAEPGPAVPFTGWLGLATALERVISFDEGSAPEPEGPESADVPASGTEA